MKLHEEWIFKAYNDLQSAKILFNSDENLNDTAIYHTQQCAEKSLKAYLSFCNLEIPKTHDLKTLLKKCNEQNDSFLVILEFANYLNPFSAFFRYPGFDALPSDYIVSNAIFYAERIYKFVKNELNITL
ncbi:MAG: HEPN domain-containing protein [Spirochaetales bacterium]|nr:HEPN domain-containing protein [Spirochaetales bacterium]